MPGKTLMIIQFLLAATFCAQVEILNGQTILEKTKQEKSKSSQTLPDPNLKEIDNSPVSSAKKLLLLLPDSLSSKSLFSLQDTERLDWNYIPKIRKGLPIGKMAQASYQATFELLRSCLSQKGYTKIVDIITQLEPMLIKLENRKPGDHFRDPGKYYLSIFGTPEYGKFWAWRLEGHHVSCNFVLKGDRIVSATPLFLGSNPARIPEGLNKGKEVLHGTIINAFELIHSFDISQLKIARLSLTPEINSIVGHTSKPVKSIRHGISLQEMHPAQQIMFWSLLNAYLENFKPYFSEALLDSIKKTGSDTIFFCWKGGLTQGRLYYYKIQTPFIEIEHDNTQNEGNHVHSVIRDYNNDFGVNSLNKEL